MRLCIRNELQAAVFKFTDMCTMCTAVRIYDNRRIRYVTIIFLCYFFIYVSLWLWYWTQHVRCYRSLMHSSKLAHTHHNPHPPNGNIRHPFSHESCSISLFFFFFVMYTMCSHIAGIIVMWWDCICIYYHEPHMHTHTHEHKMINNIKPESVPLTSLHYVSPHILNISRCSTNATSNWYCSISIIINIFFDALYMSIEHE